MKISNREHQNKRLEAYKNAPIEIVNNTEYRVIRSFYYKSNILKSEFFYTLDNAILIGAAIVKEYYRNGQLKSYKEAHKKGGCKSYITYSEDGQITNQIELDESGNPLKKQSPMN